MRKDPMPRTALRVTVVQNSAGADPRANRRRVERLLAQSGPADVIALPEVWAFRTGEAGYRRRAEPIPGPLTDYLAGLATTRNAWVLGGSLIERAGRHIFNTSVCIDRQGAVVARYRKIHLFEATLDTGQIIREADAYDPGKRPVLTAVEGWQCGMAICYDIRFPELFRIYSAQGAHLFFVPSNFTQRTGRDHWDVLVRARAIENQCFVVAPNQSGANPATGVVSHGHSMVVGPWGEVLGVAGTGEQAFTVSLDPALLSGARRRVPALQHRRL